MLNEKCIDCGPDSYPPKAECMNLCPSDPNMQNLENRNNQCLAFCGARIRHGYADINSICSCKTRKIFPCSELKDKQEYPFPMLDMIDYKKGIVYILKYNKE